MNTNNITKLLYTITRVRKRSGRGDFKFTSLSLMTINHRLHAFLCSVVESHSFYFCVLEIRTRSHDIHVAVVLRSMFVCACIHTWMCAYKRVFAFLTLTCTEQMSQRFQWVHKRCPGLIQCQQQRCTQFQGMVVCLTKHHTVVCKSNSLGRIAHCRSSSPC